MAKQNKNIKQTCIIVLLVIATIFIVVSLVLAACKVGFAISIEFVLAVLTAYFCAERECVRAKELKFLKYLNVIITVVALFLIIKAAYF